MENINCIICGSGQNRLLFSKPSRHGEMFDLVRCSQCGLEFVNPRPFPADMGKYYGGEYFKERTERGYDNYFSDAVRSEIERVMEMNLGDLSFFEFESGLSGKKHSLDIGCAAGYFVSYLAQRGWVSRGIDVAPDCVEFACKQGLDVMEGDYLSASFGEKFNLITLWASIEHLHCPDRFLEKIYRDLEDNGKLFISTCRAGGMNFMKLFGSRWRFYNFPEHLYFFSRGTLKKILEQKGFRVTRYITYGSGIGKPGTYTRKIADVMAKKLKLGDMMLIAAEKS